MRRLVPILAIALLAGCQRSSPSTASFAWQGGLEDDAWVRIRNTNGRIEVRRSPDARVTVGAEVKTGGRPVTWVRDSSAAGATFCVLFRRTHETSCDAPGSHGRSTIARLVDKVLFGIGSGESSVKYVLWVPEHVRLDLRTTNGAIDVQSVARQVRARTTNGKVTAIAVTGGLDIETINGSIDADLDLSGDGVVSLKTVNGSISAKLPESLDAEVDLSTVNGSASSEFALEGDGRKHRHGTVGTVGAGGRKVVLKAVNGSVALRRRA
jgi:hypothetical protein